MRSEGIVIRLPSISTSYLQFRLLCEEGGGGRGVRSEGMRDEGGMGEE